MSACVSTGLIFEIKMGCVVVGFQISQAMVSPWLPSWKIIDIWSKFEVWTIYQVLESYGTLWTVGTSVQGCLANVCNLGFYSTYLSPKSGNCRKNKLSQILPDIPYQTSMKPQHISPPSLARSSAAKLVKGKGTSTKTHSNKLLVYIWWQVCTSSDVKKEAVWTFHLSRFSPFVKFDKSNLDK